MPDCPAPAQRNPGAGTALLDVTVSLVSHGQGRLILALLQQLAALAAAPRRVILTLNRPEPWLQEQLAAMAWPFELLLTVNPRELGLGSNHNAAFERDASLGASPAFAVINPDIGLRQGNPFAESLRILDAQPEVALVYPQQVDRHGAAQDHRRLLPTPGRLLRRRLGLRHELPAGAAPDWVNAALLVLRRGAFASVDGFDPRYHLYCEDVDLCLRLQLKGWQLAATGAIVMHAAARASHRNPRYLRWHLQSLWRLWRSEAYAAFRRGEAPPSPRPSPRGGEGEGVRGRASHPGPFPGERKSFEAPHPGPLPGGEREDESE